jgi:hypothetical protein
MSLVMRLETAAEHYNRRVAKSMAIYDFSAADMRELLLEAARRIKELESVEDRLECMNQIAMERSMFGDD